MLGGFCMKFKVAFQRGKKLKFLTKIYFGTINIENDLISIIYNRKALLIHEFNSISIIKSFHGKYVVIEGNNENLYLFPYTIPLFAFYFTSNKHYAFFYSCLESYLENKNTKKNF